MKRIFLVAQQPRLRAALVQTIQDQGAPMLRVVGTTAWDAAALHTIVAAQPDVVVLVVGFTAREHLQALTVLRQQLPACRLLVIDTLELFDAGLVGAEAMPDALLSTTHLVTELVSTIQRLGACRSATASDGAPQHGLSGYDSTSGG